MSPIYVSEQNTALNKEVLSSFIPGVNSGCRSWDHFWAPLEGSWHSGTLRIINSWRTNSWSKGGFWGFSLLLRNSNRRVLFPGFNTRRPVHERWITVTPPVYQPSMYRLRSGTYRTGRREGALYASRWVPGWVYTGVSPGGYIPGCHS